MLDPGDPICVLLEHVCLIAQRSHVSNILQIWRCGVFSFETSINSLAVRSPYTSAWSTTINGITLNSRNVTFWDGTQLGWVGIARVDGQSYEYLVDSPSIASLLKAAPLCMSYDSHYSNLTFGAGPVLLTARFLSPVLPSDPCESNVPLSYLEVSYRSTNGKPHTVGLYSDVNGMWLADGNLPIRWSSRPPSGDNTASRTMESKEADLTYGDW